jgi:outer membrane protein assembly factor BamB
MSFPTRLLVTALICTIASAASAPASDRAHQAMGGQPRQVEKISQLKDLRLTTVICKGRQAQAILAIPDDDVHKALAAEINARIRKCGGVELPVAVNKTPAELLPQMNVIALGNLADNPFIEKLYFRWFCFTDRWYPGKGGYEVRSIHDPLGTGTNVILLGGSDAAGASEAVRRFCSILEPASFGALSVGRLFDLRLGQNLKPPSDANRTPPLLRLFVEGLEMPLGYNEASRLGLMHYYTGEPKYARAFMDAARRSHLFAQADHYHAHHNALVWDLIEESPLFTDADRLFVTNEIFEHALSGESGGGLAALSGGPDSMFDRHAGFIGLSALTDIRYLARDYPRQEWEGILSAVDGYFRPRLGSFASGSDLARGIYTYLEALVIYSLLTGNHEIVRSGALRAWADRCAAMCDPLGFLVPSGQYDAMSYPYFTFRKAAFLLKDPGLLYLSGMRQRAADSQGVYELGMEFDQGQAFAGDIEPRPPHDLTGVRVVPLDDRERREFDPGMPPNKAFAKITFRSGLGEDDQFLVLDGIWGGPAGKPIQDANAILQFSDGGRTFLVDVDPETQNRRSSTVNHNVLSVTRDGQAPVPPRLAALESVADLPSIGCTHTRLDPYMEGSWDRHIVWRKGAYFVVVDAFRAGRAGTFALESQWRLLGRAEASEGGFTSTVGGTGTADSEERTIICKTVGVAGDKDAPSTWPVRFTQIDISAETVRRQYGRYAPPVINRLRPTAALNLEEGGETGIAALFYTTSQTEARRYSVTAAGRDTFFITGDEPAWLKLAGKERRFTRGPLNVEADVVWVTKTAAAAGRLTLLELDDRALLRTETPVAAEWDFARGACVLSLDQPAVVEVASRGKLKLEPGEHRFSGLPVAEGPTADRLSGIFEQPSSGPTAVIDEALQPALTAPTLPAVSEPWPGMAVNTLRIVGKGEKTQALLGCEDGRVIRSDRRGRTKWEFQTDGPVHAIETASFQPGVQAVLAGSDDGALYALDLETGRKLWAHRAEVYPETAIYPWWTLDGRAKVRSVLAADLDGDGKTEIALGTGGMQVEMVDVSGALVWRQPVKYGLPVRLLALRSSSGGPQALLAGLDFLASQAGLFRFRHDGTLESADAFPSGREGWDYTGVSALAAIEHPGAQNRFLAVGRSGAFNEVGLYDLSSGRSLGKAQVGDTVSGIIWMDAGKDPLAVAATEAGWVMALRPDGWVAWSVPLPDAVDRLWKAGEEAVAAWCRSGDYFILDASGRVRGRGRASWAAAMFATSTP